MFKDGSCEQLKERKPVDVDGVSEFGGEFWGQGLGDGLILKGLNCKVERFLAKADSPALVEHGLVVPMQGEEAAR